MFKKVLALVSSLFFITAPHATAAEYSYWSYWHGSGSDWVMSNEGATYIPADGSVEGWRFVKTADTDTPPTPRLDARFSCPTRLADAGTKQVRVVVDYGTVVGSGGEEKQIRTGCVTVPESADGFAVLEAFEIAVGTDKGMVCGLDGVPTDGCPTAVTTTIKTTSSEKKQSPYVNAGLILLAAVALIGLVQLRKVRTK